MKLRGSRFDPHQIRVDKPVSDRVNNGPTIILSTHMDREDKDFFLDADHIHEGDYITCPTHSDNVIWVFGTSWWFDPRCKMDNDSFTTFNMFCGLCKKNYSVLAWSYMG